MKKFFKKTEGFTLVELIVVIAILGILAGVGTVGYSGYIKKAQLAADEQLLAAVNQAYAAACIENGKDMSKMTASEAKINLGDGANGGRVVASIAPADYQDEFVKYYAGNENAEFKVLTALIFRNGMFVPAGDNSVSWAVNGGEITLTFSDADVNTVNGSTFTEGVGVGTLMNQVDAITDLASSVLNGDGSGKGNQLINGILTSDGFLTFAASATGDTLSKDDLNLALLRMNGDSDAAAAIDGWSDEKKAELNKLMGEGVLTNAMVLYAANQADGLNTETFRSELAAMDIDGTSIDASGNASSGDMLALGLKAYDSIYGTGGSQANAGDALAKAAYGYGMSIAYGNYKAQEGNGDVTWSEYLNSDQGKKDFDAYAACMSLIDSNASNVNTTSALLQNGFNDAGLIAAINSALGK